jgi:Fe2+ or Zn2+ uptake regulation protein
VRRGKSRQSRLADVLLSLLGGHTEPRLAKELRDELLAKHPDRNPTPQVVRNTIESLVAKGRVHRHKQQRSVTYTLAQSGESDTSSTTEDAD